MEKFFYTFLFIASVFVDGAVACPKGPPVLSENQIRDLYASAVNKGVLLRGVKGNDAVWLYGTVHFNKLENSVPGPELLNAIVSSDAIFVEIDPLREINVQKIKRALGSGNQLEISDKPIAKLMLQALCLPTVLLDQPAAKVVQFMLHAKLREANIYADYASDLIVAALAHRYGKPIYELENAESQYSTLLGDSQQSSWSEHLHGLQSGSVVHDVNDILEGWAQGDIKMLKLFAERNGVLDPLMLKRNKTMASKLADHLKSQPQNTVLIAVGVFHLVGGGSLVELLEQSGFVFEKSDAISLSPI